MARRGATSAANTASRAAAASNPQAKQTEQPQSFRSDEGYHTQENGHVTPARSDGTNSQHTTGFDGDFAISAVVSEANKVIVETVAKLESIGMEAGVLELPYVVVVGDQSAGKSSLISAITGVPTARNHTTCTRVPLHINLLSTDDPEAKWTCSIALVSTYSYFGGLQDPSLKYGGWQESAHPVETPFAVVTDHADLHAMLQRAQKALLNPGKNPQSFRHAIPAELERASQVQFSPNTIRLDISAPNVPNLSIYDLPGIINQTGRDNEHHLPELIRELASHYIEEERSIVVLASSLETELDNSLTWNLVQQCEAQKRCLGVLTKPDRLPKAYPLDRIQNILSGRSFRLGHGYYVTRQPDQEQINQGISYEAARDTEVKFFETITPWSSHLQRHQNQFGTKSLNDRLSTLLEGAIRERIPDLMKEVHDKIALLDSRLAKMPEQPQNVNPLVAVAMLLNDLQHGLEKRMAGEISHNRFVLQWMELCDQYKNDMFQMRPILLTRTPGTAPQGSALPIRTTPGLQDAISILSDDEELFPSTPMKRKRAIEPETPSPSKRQRGDPRSKAPQRHGNYDTTEDSSSKSNRPGLAQRFGLDEIRQALKDNTTSAIPNRADPKADEFLIQESIKNWYVPHQKLLQKTAEALKATIEDLLHGYASAFALTPLPKAILGVANEFVTGASQRHEELASRLIEAELLKPMTMYSVQEEELKERSIFEDARKKMRTLEIEAKLQDGTPKKSKAEEEKQKKELGELGVDPYSAEVETMARVRAYYNIASKSIVDVLVRAMRLDLLERCNKLLVKALKEQFGLEAENGMEICTRLVAEDPERVKEREELKAERSKYEEVRITLDELAQKVSLG